MQFKNIDIFCHIIDNFGDVGVMYRFAKEFKLAQPLCKVRVFLTDLKPLVQILPPIDPAKSVQVHSDITFVNSLTLSTALVNDLGTADVLIEAFGCTIPEAVLQKAALRNTLIVNLEYLSAEKWTADYHLKESLQNQPTLKKYFFMPGFTRTSGGVILDTHIEAARKSLGENRMVHIEPYLKDFKTTLSNWNNAFFGSVFTYIRGFDTLVSDLQNITKPVCLFVCGEKSHASMKASLGRCNATSLSTAHYRVNNVNILIMPFLPQPLYDRLLCLTDFNIVRGEDSFVRAILSGKPFIWNAYLQDNIYHRVKVTAFLEEFKKYCGDPLVFKHYADLVIEFNQAAFEQPRQITHERYDHFFRHLNKIEHATQEMSYFIRLNCDLVKNFIGFLNQIKMETFQ